MATIQIITPCSAYARTSTSSRVVARLRPGTVLSAEEPDDLSDFFRVSVQGQPAYVLKQHAQDVLLEPAAGGVMPRLPRLPALSPRLARILGVVGLVGSLAVAAYGQHIIDDRGTLGTSWPLLSSFDAKLTTIYHAPQSVAYAIPLFFIAGLLFALSLRALISSKAGPIAGREAAAAAGWLRELRAPVPAVLTALSIGGWTYLIVQLALGRNQSSNWWLFWGSLACAAAALLYVDRRRKAQVLATLRWHPWELVFVGAVAGLFIGLMVQDLTSWQYARIGDEGVFWEFARKIAEGDNDFNFFSERGGYGYIPVMSSVYQGYVMRVAGVDIFGWKLASTLAIAASFPVFYWLVRTLIGVRPAAFGTAILGASHYLFAYAHTGYPNIQALFPTILAFAFLFAGLRSRSVALLFGSGVSAGLGFYTFYSSRTAIVIVAAAVLILGVRELKRAGVVRWLQEVPLPVAAGFIMTVAPIFAVDRWQVIDDMQRQSLFAERGTIDGLTMLLYNVPRSFMSFNFQLNDHHYVSGSLLDEVSAVLAVLGLSYALYRRRDEGFRFLVLWFVVATVVTGVFHPRLDTELPSRLHYALPPAAAFAGLALDRIVRGFASFSSSRRLELALGLAAFVIVLPALLGFNAHRFWKETPRRHQLSPTTVVYREVVSELCTVEGQRTVVYASDGQFESMKSVFEYYRLEDRSPLVFPYEGPLEVYEELIDVTRVSCILFVEPEREEARPVLPVFLKKAAAFGSSGVIAEDTTGKTMVLVLPWLGAPAGEAGSGGSRAENRAGLSVP